MIFIFRGWFFEVGADERYYGCADIYIYIYIHKPKKAGARCHVKQTSQTNSSNGAFS